MSDATAGSKLAELVSDAFAKPDREDRRRKRDEDMQAVVLLTNLHWGLPAEVARPDMEKYFGERFDGELSFVRLCEIMDRDIPELANKLSTKDFARGECHHCGERFTYKRVGPDRYQAGDTPCAYPGGMPVYDVLLNVPSGRIAFANDLRVLVELPDADAHHDISSSIGQRRYVEAYAAYGMAHVYTGNSCPSVWQQDGRLAVANYRTPGVDDDEDDFPLEGLITPVAEQGVDLGSICTDLWWYSAMDYDEFAARCAEHGYSAENMADFIVDVAPGTYAFSVEHVQRDTASEVFSYITRTDRVAPPLRRINRGLAETVETSLAWGTIEYFTKREAFGYSQVGAIHYLLCVNGNGYDWSGGFLTSGSRGSDTPFRKLDENSPVDHPLMHLVPVLPFSLGVNTMLGNPTPAKLYPINYDYAEIIKVPEIVDPWWLSVALLFATAASVDTSAFRDEEGRDPEKARLMMRQGVYAMLEIVEARGGEAFIRPYLDAWMASGISFTAGA